MRRLHKGLTVAFMVKWRTSTQTGDYEKMKKEESSPPLKWNGRMRQTSLGDKSFVTKWDDKER